MAKATDVCTTSEDPIYLAIERHRDATVAGARLALLDEGLTLIKTRPTTVGGIIAALAYIAVQLKCDTMPADIVLDTAVGSTSGGLTSGSLRSPTPRATSSRGIKRRAGHDDRLPDYPFRRNRWRCPFRRHRDGNRPDQPKGDRP